MRILVAMLGGLLLSDAALAAQFQNGSFEQGNFVSNRTENGNDAKTDQLAAGDTSMPGWTVIGTGDVSWELNGNPYGIVASDGSYSLDLTGYRDASPYGGVRQTFDVFAGHDYALMFDVGASSAYTSADGASVMASINGVTLGTATNMDLSQSTSWATGTFYFSTGNSSTAQLDLVGMTGTHFIGLDNVKVADLGRTAGATVSAVPEPASWALMVGGFGLLGAAMRRRRAGDALFIA